MSVRLSVSRDYPETHSEDFVGGGCGGALISAAGFVF